VKESNSKHITVKVVIKIEDICFDRRLGILFKRGPNADIRYAPTPLAVNQSGARIYSEPRNDTIVRVKICRRKTDRVAPAITANNDAFDALRAPQHPADQVHASFGQALTNAG